MMGWLLGANYRGFDNPQCAVSRVTGDLLIGQTHILA